MHKKLQLGLITTGICLLTLVLLVPGAKSQERAQEVITNFESLIVVNLDGSLTVQETITVNALGEEIKRGIYRDFPTRYQDNLGNNYRVGFEILKVLRDGQIESYHTEKLDNGIRTYIGQSNYYLPSGQYTYTFEYRTTRQLGFFQDHDELYWNVTGNGWIFPIEKVRAKVILPTNIPSNEINFTGYTGLTGSQAKDFTTEHKSQQVEFTTTKVLNPYEGLTIVVGWPKGYVQAPSQMDKTVYWLKDNAGILISSLGLLLLFIYYLVAWSKFGNDPNKGTIIPQYEPPANMAATDLRYVQKMQCDNKVFTTKIIEMAINGLIRIEKTKGTFTSHHYLHQIPGQEKRATTLEQGIIRPLFAADSKIELKNENYKQLQAAKKVLSDELKNKIENKLFKLNTQYFLIGIGFSFLVIILAFMVGASGSIPPLIFLPIGLIVILNIIFFRLLKTPTKEGRQILDHLEGFKWFLSVTEKDRMNFHNPPERTPELFEKFLPYALALGVENKWAEQFASVFAQLEQAGQPYQPAWYSGAHFTASQIGGLTHSLGSSFASAVSAASTAPGSSSGFGGSSGGGGGGGGGGGW